MTPGESSVKAPEPRPVRIKTLIDQVSDGRIKVPTFQRREIWTTQQVLDLLDSIRHGYPLGSLLLWRTDQQLKSERNIGGFDLPNTPVRTPRDYVLDGQQRITALFATMSRSPEQLGDRYQVLYDLMGKEFVAYSTQHGPEFIPINGIFDPHGFRALQDRIHRSENPEELENELDGLYETLRNYEVPVVVTIDTKIEDVGIIFERINRRGTRLTLFDLMVAATWGEGDDEFNLREQIDLVTRALSDQDFDDLDGTTVLRCMSAIEHTSARRDRIESLRNQTTANLRLLIERTRESLKRAIDFLTSAVNVQSFEFLPYERQLVAITHFMSRNGRIGDRDNEALKRWFWLTSFTERYRRGGEAQFDEDLASLLRVPRDRQVLEDRFGSPPEYDFFINTEFRRSSAAALAFASLLAHRRPVNLTNGAAIDVGTALSSFNRKEFHHIFPRKILRDAGTESSLADSLGNICMLASSENKGLGSQPPSRYLTNIRNKIGAEAFDQRMEANLIPPDATAAAMEDDYGRFLRARAQWLERTVRNLVG